MENQHVKRTKFSPSDIEQIEYDFYSRLCGTDNWYEVPEDFKGKEPTAWDQLSTSFPVPVVLQDKVQLLLFQLNYRGCPLYYTSNGLWLSKTDMQDSYSRMLMV